MHAYSATGNIIGLVDNTKTPNDSSDTLSQHTVGQLILYPPLSPVIQIFNKDGSNAKQCGNGLIALATHLVKENFLIKGFLLYLPQK